MVEMIAAEVTPMAEKLLAAFMPGPITLILRRKAIVPDRITGASTRSASACRSIRWPRDDPRGRRADRRSLGQHLRPPESDDGGLCAARHEGAYPADPRRRPCHFGVESTIVDCTGPVAVILRPGAITREMLTEVLGGCKLDPALVGADTVQRAPGMKYKHYAPKAP